MLMRVFTFHKLEYVSTFVYEIISYIEKNNLTSVKCFMREIYLNTGSNDHEIDV